MGTIGDHLGSDLLALFGGVGEAPSENADEAATETGENRGHTDIAGPPGGADGEVSLDEGAHGVPDDTADVTHGEHIEGVVRSVIAELTGRPADECRLTDSLASLDVTGLALWAVVAEVEREVASMFPDSQVEQWVSIGDIVEAARTKKG